MSKMRRGGASQRRRESHTGGSSSPSVSIPSAVIRWPAIGTTAPSAHPLTLCGIRPRALRELVCLVSLKPGLRMQATAHPQHKGLNLLRLESPHSRRCAVEHAPVAMQASSHASVRIGTYM